MITLKQVQKHFDNEKIIFQDKQFEANASYVLLGPSGCGKSTLLNLVGGFIRPTTGNIEITLPNQPLLDLSSLSTDELAAYRRTHVSYISQQYKLFEAFTIHDNLSLMEQVKPTTVSVLEAATLVGLEHKLKQKVATLSGGEKQRVCIARALMQQADILLCDEPTASLNYTLATEIISLLVKVHKEQQNTLIVVTHDERLTSYFDYVIPYEAFLATTSGGDQHVTL